MRGSSGSLYPLSLTFTSHAASAKDDPIHPSYDLFSVTCLPKGSRAYGSPLPEWETVSFLRPSDSSIRTELNHKLHLSPPPRPPLSCTLYFFLSARMHSCGLSVFVSELHLVEFHCVLCM